MKLSKELIESFIYTQQWVKYRLYSSDCYKLFLETGIYFILNNKENYITGKSDFLLQIYIEGGHCIYTARSIDINLKKLDFIDVNDYITSIITDNKEV